MVYQTISVGQAVFAAILAFLYFIFGIYFVRNRRSNRYPLWAVSGLLWSASIWVLSNVIVDRTTSPWVRLWVGRGTFLPAFAVVVFFVFFALWFPEVSSKAKKQVIGSFSLIIAGAGSILSMSPQGIFKQIDTSVDQYLSTNSLWLDISLHAGYVLLTLVAILLLFSKIKAASANDKKAIGLISLSLLVNIMIIIPLSIFSIENVGASYYQYYSYTSSALFFVSFVYAILKYGALAKSFSLPRKIVVILLMALIIAMFIIKFV